jgi:hypothetical protein
MTEMVLHKDKSSPGPRRAVLAIAAIYALSATSSEGFSYDGPTLRRGLWKFERTLETNGKPTDRRQTDGLLIDRHITRCVDPTKALKAEFMPLEVGACNVRDVRKKDDGYVLQKSCRGTTPIKTEINIKGDSAYTEINEGKIGKIPTKEIVEAHRVGDCHSQREG